MTVTLGVRFAVDDARLDTLHRLAFGTAPGPVTPWAERLERHALTWVGAFAREDLVGFVHACWDGGSHAFLLDTAVHPGHRRTGVGRDLVRALAGEVRAAGCRWLHADYEPHLAAFYEGCGFRPTAAGLLDLA